MLRFTAPVLLLAACAPQNAQISNASYVAFLSEGTSLSLAKEEVDPTRDGWSASYNVDCREFETQAEENTLRLDEPIDICGNQVWPPLYEEWATQAGYRVVSEEIDAWRGEAVITAEGDLQIGFHHTMNGGADMRVIIVVDPDFAPQRCVAKDGGGVEREPVDGDWVDNWSRELDYLAGIDEEYAEAYAHMEPYLDGGRLFFLNAFAYQLNPRALDDFWNLPEQWLSGAALGKAAEELVNHRTPRYAEPFVYNFVEVASTPPPITESELWFCDLPAGADPTQEPCMEALGETIETTANGVYDELNRLFNGRGDSEPVFHFRPITHLNDWRAPDGVPAGLDGWGEMHYNYVVFDGDISNLQPGDSASGAFSLVLDAGQSSSRMFVKGEFVIDKVKKDRWTTDDLQTVKAEENEADLCFL
jgi:hypothetical protein